MPDTVSELISLNERIRGGSLFFESHTGRNDSEGLFETFGISAFHQVA
jgi:hypothetical protein